MRTRDSEGHAGVTPFRDLRLSGRLLLGGGRRDAARGVAMTLGVAMAVFAALISTAAPRAQHAAQDVLISRAPVWGEQTAGTGGLQLSTTDAAVGTRPWTRVSVSGVEAGSPLPPGVSAWPALGSSLVSPALRRIATSDRDIAGMLGTLAPGAIGSDGLTDPDELMSYTVTSGSTVTSASSASSVPSGNGDGTAAAGGGATHVVTGFGNATMVDRSGSSRWLMIEIALLVLTPALLFLLTALRLSLASRSRRTFALGLIGMSPRRTAALYAREVSVIALAGFLVGAGVYQGVQSEIGRSRVLGVGWWPAQARLGWPLFVLAGLLTLAVVRGVATSAMRAAASRSRSQSAGSAGSAGSTHRWIGAAAGAVALLAVGFLATVVVTGAARPSTAYASGSSSLVIAVTVAAALLSVVNGTPGLIARAAEAVAPRFPGAVGLGLRGAAHRVVDGKRLISVVAATVVLSGIGAAFVHALLLGAEGDPTRAEISLDVADVKHVEHWSRALPDGQFIVETTLQGHAVTIGDCPAVTQNAFRFYEHPGACTDVVQRSDAGAIFGSGGAAVESLTVGRTTVAVPRAPLTADMPWDLKFPLHDAPWLDELSQGQITYQVSRTDGSYQRVLGALGASFPGVAVNAGIKDPDRYSVYRQQVGTVRAGIVLGMLLSVFSFILAALEGRWHRARSVVALAAIGAPTRALRAANMVEFAFPLLVAILPAAAVAVLGGWSILSFWGTRTMFSAQVPLWTTTGSVVSVVCGAATGWLTGKGAFRRDALADS